MYHPFRVLLSPMCKHVLRQQCKGDHCIWYKATSETESRGTWHIQQWARCNDLAPKLLTHTQNLAPIYKGAFRKELKENRKAPIVPGKQNQWSMKNTQLKLTHLKQYSIIIDKRDTNSISGEKGKRCVFSWCTSCYMEHKKNPTLRTVA